MSIRSMCDFCVWFSMIKVLCNRTLIITQYLKSCRLYDGSLKCIYCKCNANLPPSKKSNGKKNTCHFTVQDYTNLQHPVPKMSVYAILYI